MADQFLGEIRIVPFNFAPQGWATCSGQILPISQNTALFSLLGTNFGGNGTSNFGLPNFIGNAAMDAGNGNGLTQRLIGETGGSTNVTLNTNELAAHTHGQLGDSTVASSTSPANNLSAVPAAGPRHPNELYAVGAATTAMLANNLTQIGGNQPHNNMQPFLALTFVIALTGIFPPRQ